MNSNTIPWELLLPAEERGSVLWLGGDPGLLRYLRSIGTVCTAATSGPYAVAIRGARGPASLEVLPESLRAAIRGDTDIVWVSCRSDGRQDGELLPEENDGNQALHFVAGGRSLWQVHADWADALQSTAKSELVLRTIRRWLRRSPDDTAAGGQFNVMLTVRTQPASGAWLVELVDRFKKLGIAGISRRSIGRIDKTLTGAAIVQLSTSEGSRYCVKVAFSDSVSDEMAHEDLVVEDIRALLADSPELLSRLPQNLASGRSGGRYFRIYRWLPGRSALELMYQPQRRDAVMDNAIRWMTKLHQTTMRGSLDVGKVSHRAHDILEQFELQLRCAGGFAKRIADYLRTRLSRQSCRVVFGHGDFWLGNVLYNPDNLDVRGVIDWGSGDDAAPPLEDLLHILCHRKSLISIYDPGRRIAAMLHADAALEDQHRIADYLRCMAIPLEQTAALIILYWVRYLDSRRPTLSSRRGWYRRSFVTVRNRLRTLDDDYLDGLGAKFAS